MKKITNHHNILSITFVLILCIVFSIQDQANAQRRGRRAQGGPPTLGLEKGFMDFNTPDFKIKLVRASQTIAALQPRDTKGFDFTPADQLQNRSSDNFYQLGDITLRLRTDDSGEWKTFSTAAARKPVIELPVSGQILAVADLSPTLPADFPLQITRSWLLENGKLVLRFTLKNKTSDTIQIGALGIPLIFNNYITGKRLSQAHEMCSFSDPAICLDAGYVQVTRLSGKGPALIVVPDDKTPFEAYNPLLNDATQRSQTFEGFYEWLVYSRAFAENEWKDAQPWNNPSMTTIETGGSKSFGLKFLLADQIRNIEKTLAVNNRPVAVGIPGYVLPMDIDGKLFLRYQNKETKTAIQRMQRIFAKVTSVEFEPKEAITIEKNDTLQNGWSVYTLKGKKWGRARLTITYDDGLKQSINYYVIKPSAQAIADLGNFSMTKQWFTEPNDPFKRSPSVMSYDRELNQIVTQDSRVWIAGLGDEGGSGPYVAAAMKEFGQPNKDELAKYEQFVNKVLWGGIQYSEGPNQYGVRKSLFYYEPNEFPAGFYSSKFNWGSWTSWNKRDAAKIDRAYNYPHVVATYWTMYRLARNNTGLVTSQNWDWFLERAYQTVKFLNSRDQRNRPKVGYLNTGLMEGDIFVMLLKDLKREDWKEKADEIEKMMKTRADRWNKEAYPFGSEMAWDSTGQEEVYAWCKYFGYNDKADVTLNAVLGYMPTVPNWGYNGNARRYWDFQYAAKIERLERQIHHYGSGINAIPVLAAYREKPDDFYLLRVGYGGTMGALTNIDQEGFASAAFHAWPSALKWDPYTGDYGPNFFGHAVNTATYIVKHPDFGWISFGSNVSVDGNVVKAKILDSFKKRIYIAPYGLYLTLDSGTFDAVEIDTDKKTIRLGLSPATQYTPNARLRIEQPAKITGVGKFKPSEKFNIERDAFIVPLKAKTTWIELGV